MNLNKFSKLRHIGDISKINSKAISSIYCGNGNFYVIDIVPFTKQQQYFLYEVSVENILNFIKNKDNKSLLPQENQLVYEIYKFDFKIKDVHNYNNNLNISFQEDYWECCDLNKIQSFLKQKKS